MDKQMLQIVAQLLKTPEFTLSSPHEEKIAQEISYLYQTDQKFHEIASKIIQSNQDLPEKEFISKVSSCLEQVTATFSDPQSTLNAFAKLGLQNEEEEDNKSHFNLVFDQFNTHDFDFNFQQRCDFQYLQQIIDDQSIDMKTKNSRIKDFDYQQLIQSQQLETELLSFINANLSNNSQHQYISTIIMQIAKEVLLTQQMKYNDLMNNVICKSGQILALVFEEILSMENEYWYLISKAECQIFRQVISTKIGNGDEAIILMGMKNVKLIGKLFRRRNFRLLMIQQVQQYKLLESIKVEVSKGRKMELAAIVLKQIIYYQKDFREEDFSHFKAILHLMKERSKVLYEELIQEMRMFDFTN